MYTANTTRGIGILTLVYLAALPAGLDTGIVVRAGILVLIVMDLGLQALRRTGRLPPWERPLARWEYWSVIGIGLPGTTLALLLFGLSWQAGAVLATVEHGLMLVLTLYGATMAQVARKRDQRARAAEEAKPHGG